MTNSARPKIYHIVHVDNLASIIADGCLWSDVEMRVRRPVTSIGMEHIKQRRRRLPVDCHVGLAVGQCVPFYLCPRSVMLFVIHRANVAELPYRGGQDPIVHIEADLRRTVAWAVANERRWAVSLSNAGSPLAEFRTGRFPSTDLRWDAIVATDFRDPEIQEAKQAEFLIETSFPWSLVETVGCVSRRTLEQVTSAVSGCANRPRTTIRPEWYFEEKRR